METGLHSEIAELRAPLQHLEDRDELGALVLLPPELYITLFIPRSRWVVVGAGEISRHRWTIHLHQILLNFKTT